MTAMIMTKCLLYQDLILMTVSVATFVFGAILLIVLTVTIVAFYAVC